MALPSLVMYGTVGTSAHVGIPTPRSWCNGGTLQLQTSQHSTGGLTVQVPGFFAKVGYLKKNAPASWRRSSNYINRSSTLLQIRACQGELLDLGAARGIATSPAEDLPATSIHHELVNFGTTLLGNSKKNVDVEVAGGRGAVSSSSSCAQSAPEKRRVICISGPTAVGKTRLSIELAKSLGGEIINADSVQVYKSLDVGAAKVSADERQGVPHHLMDLVLPTIEYTYGQFLADARAATEEILAKGLVPIVIGGTGMYMRWYMQNKQGITSHPFPGEDTEGLKDHLTEWDYDFQCYFLYQHRADLYSRDDIRCEQMIPELLKETSWLLDLGVRPGSNTAAKAIGYDEAVQLLLEARGNGGVVSHERFRSFLSDFQHNSKGLVRKQIAWFRHSARSEVRKFRWVQAGQSVEQMMELLANEYRKAPGTPPSDFSSGEILKLASLKEQKRMKNYKPEFKVYSDPEAVSSALKWIRATQSPYGSLPPANGISISSDVHAQPMLHSKL